jgi:hypothetical protein
MRDLSPTGEALALAGLDAAEPEMRSTSDGTQTVGHAVATIDQLDPHPGSPDLQATHALVTSTEIIRLTLTSGDRPLASIPLGSADAVRLASDLLNAARVRCGR